MINLSFIEQIKQTYQKYDYPFFEKGDYNLNLGGVRAASSTANSWDDLIFAIYKQFGTWRIETFQATTDPGNHWLAKPMKKSGTAILCEGHHKGLFKLGLHRGRYEALVQNNKVSVYRDNNKDNIIDIDPSTIEKGNFGINLHRASPSDYKDLAVGKWSAGCQVVKHADNLNELMLLANIAANKWGNSISYTLFTEEQFNLGMASYIVNYHK